MLLFFYICFADVLVVPAVCFVDLLDCFQFFVSFLEFGMFLRANFLVVLQILPPAGFRIMDSLVKQPISVLFLQNFFDTTIWLQWAGVGCLPGGVLFTPGWWVHEFLRQGIYHGPLRQKMWVP